ncbi:LysM peptidoglycan-binding domain-containing protein, partial [Patescibacteria group bacterium]
SVNSNIDKGNLVYINGLKAIKVKKGQTKNDLALAFELKVRQLERYNEIGPGDALYEGELIFLEPKRSSAEPAYKVHEVKSGDTFYSIAQQYGMKMKSLMRKNNMWFGSIIKQGDKLNLRKKKKLNNHY